MKSKITYLSSLILLTAINCKKSETHPTLSSKDSTVTAKPDSAKIQEIKSSTTTSAKPFAEEISYRNFSFKVEAPNTEEGNTFTITPSGYSKTNEPQIQQLEKGEKVIRINFDDLDGDNNPEVLVLTHRTNPERNYPYVFSSNGNASFGPVNFQEVSNKKDYEGNDNFEVAEGKLVGIYPMMNNHKPTGKTNQIMYKMSNGEAIKQLKEASQTEY